MKKQMKKKSAGKLILKTTGKLEPLKKAARNVNIIMNWFKRFNALPSKQKNTAIRDNPDLVSFFYGPKTLGGDLLVTPLAAENHGDRDKGEFTFLTILKPLRNRLAKDYELKTGAEFMLLDAVILSYYQYIRAATRLHGYIAYDQPSDLEILARYVQPYLARANEIFLRNLEALRQMKAAPFVLKIEQAGQVNVAQKQLNVSGKPSSEAMGVGPSYRTNKTIAPPDTLLLPTGKEQS